MATEGDQQRLDNFVETEGEVWVAKTELKAGAVGLTGAIMQNVTHIAPAIAAFFFTQTIVGYAGVSFLHMPDGALVNDLALREHLVREIRTFGPDAVLATDPTVIFYRDGGINHVDHREAGIAAVDAVYPAARNPMAFPALARSGLAAHKVRRLYLFWPTEPTVHVDISATLDRKIAALEAHASQIKEPDKLAERIRAWAAEEGEAIGVPAAEALRLVVIDDDEDEGPSLE